MLIAVVEREQHGRSFISLAGWDIGKIDVAHADSDWLAAEFIRLRLRERGLFRKVAFAVVNPDRNGKLAAEITGGGSVPQLVMFRKTSKGWMRRKLVGAHSVEEVEQFIAKDLALNAAEDKDAKGDDSAGATG
jgi:hypothetical protein